MELEDPIAGYNNPRDPKSGELYVYRPGEGLSFTLCSTFEAAGDADYGYGEPMSARAYGTLEGDWAHGAGETCYTRTIDPERYPPYDPKAIQY